MEGKDCNDWKTPQVKWNRFRINLGTQLRGGMGPWSALKEVGQLAFHCQEVHSKCSLPSCPSENYLSSFPIPQKGAFSRCRIDVEAPNFSQQHSKAPGDPRRFHCSTAPLPQWLKVGGCSRLFLWSFPAALPANVVLTNRIHSDIVLTDRGPCRKKVSLNPGFFIVWLSYNILALSPQ